MSTVHRKKIACFADVYKCDDMAKVNKNGPQDEEALRLRLLRRAEGFDKNAQGFAARVGWTPTQLSNFETGGRRVPRDAALQLLKRVPGFDLAWLWTGEERGLSFDLRRRIEEARQAEAQETGQPISRPASNAS